MHTTWRQVDITSSSASGLKSLPLSQNSTKLAAAGARIGRASAAKCLLQASNTKEVEGQRHNSPLPQEKGDLAKLLPADILNTTATKYAAMPSLAWYPSPGGGTAGSGGANAVAACCSPAISHGLQLAELPSTVTYRHPSCSSAHQHPSNAALHQEGTVCPSLWQVKT